VRNLFLPDQASTYAPRLDGLYLFLCGVSVLFLVLIFGLILYFAIRYRSTSRRARSRAVHGNVWMEATWFAVPLLLTLVMFGWGATLYFETATPPSDAMTVYVVAKQWMWKLQHAEGRREVNELHVPTDQPVRVLLTSEDVIHSFYVPAFRIKMDAVPGRYSQTWFQATETGTYHLFCAEYCGTDHSRMTGRVIVMEPAAYQSWLEGGGVSMVESGRRLFERLGCQPCHQAEATQRGPSLEGRFDKPVQLSDGRTVLMDESYVRESILEPNAKIVAGYDAVMPTFKGQVSEEVLLQLIAYVKSLTREQPQRGAS